MRAASTSLVLATLLSLASAGALADSAAPGWYVTGGGGVNVLSDITVHGSPAEADVANDAGWLLSAAAGYNFRPWRAELELAYRRNDPDTWKSGGREFSGSGRLGVTSVLLNGFWDFDRGTGVVPYLGIGLGVVKIDADAWGSHGAGLGARVLDGRETLFAAQGIVGVSYVFNPNLRLSVDYRYLRSASGSFRQVSGGGGGSFRVANHSLMAGLSYHFGP
ncbi:MAG TPA: outer membrane beta-barrel protein [Azospirillum sp.]